MSISEGNSDKSCVCSMDSKDLNFKETELRLGLPGSESPQDDKNDYSHGVLKIFPSGAKRVFSDTINGDSRTWGFGSEVDFDKNSGFIVSPKIGNKILGSVCTESSSKELVKEATPKSPRPVEENKPLVSSTNRHGVAPAAKEARIRRKQPLYLCEVVVRAQVVGWPPIRSSRKNMVSSPPQTEEDANGKLVTGCHYVKVSMDGAPYLRKVDLSMYNGYKDLSSALEKMFRCFKAAQGISISDGLKESKLADLIHGSEYVLTYEDKDGDWMLVGDVPWEMFTESCKKLRIMKSSDANCLAPRAMEKCKNH